jgi:mannose-6-phosphate isomerase
MLYPFKFEPILKEIIWGGEEIGVFKDLVPRKDGIGESWEISHVKDNVSVISNGELKGKSLEFLIENYGEQLLGKKVLERFGTTFPLLIKFIDAKQPLSIQVHPDDALAWKRHQSFGKTEMWYIIRAAKDAFLYSGFARAITPEQYVQRVEDDTFIESLQKHDVQSGDVFFLPAGRVHAIGAGCFIAEIQQTSNITYRIYDYNRKDANGNTRELHTELAKDAIDYQVYPDYKLQYQPRKEEIQSLVSCPYFTTNLIEAPKGEKIMLTHTDTFSIYICMKGELTVTDSKAYSVKLKQGETVLVPAENRLTILKFKEDSQLLETYI